MPRLELKRIVLVALAMATVLGLLASIVVAKALGRVFRLPEDAALLDLEVLEPGEPEPEPERAAPTPPAPRVAADPEVAKLDWVTPIVKRSLFDSSKVDQGLDPNASTEDCPKTDLNLVLYATIVAEPETFSSALIGEEKSDSFPTGYGIGDEVQGKEVYKIEQKKVVFNVGGSLECLTVAGEEITSIVKKDDGEGGVSSDGDNKFTVEQSLLDEVLANPEALATQIRAVPHKGADGNIDGYRLSGIRKGSVFEQLGVKNGDIIHSVNGKDLTNVSNAMDAYSSLQSEKAFTFDITRKNQRQTMQYDVR
jgi:general secretion pathway protein C